MSSLYAKKSGNYVLVDFDNVTEKGLKDLIAALKRGGETVTSVEATNRKSKKDGLYVKRAKLFFETGQNITLMIGDQGDIYQLTLNGTKQPVPSAKSERELAKGLITMLQRNQAKFDKSQLKKAKKVPNTATNRPISRSLKSRVEEARKQIGALNDQVTEFNTVLSTKRGELSDIQSQEAALKAQLEAEQADTKQLREQLANAKEAM